VRYFSFQRVSDPRADQEDSSQTADEVDVSTFRGHFLRRMQASTSAIVALPLMLFYQVGILASPGRNGADFVTDALIRWCEHSMETYAGVLGATFAVYGLTMLYTFRHHRWTPRALAPTLVESTIYALSMGSAIILVLREFDRAIPQLAMASGEGLFDIVVIAAGAGVHEELLFRVVGCGMLARVLSLYIHPFGGWLFAIVSSSLVFSAAHHWGPNGELFEWTPFIYRLLAGFIFALIYRIRGAGVAIWTHTLYDVYVLALLR
jgi:hypothetical protein